MKILDIMSRSDDKFFLYLVRENLNDVFVAGQTKPRNSLLLFWATFFIAGTEPFKILLRRNIGISSIALIRLFVCVLLYLYYAGIIFGLRVLNGNAYAHTLPQKWFNNEYTEICIIFYVIFSIVLLVLGVIAYRKGERVQEDDSKLKHLYRGDSLLFPPSESDSKYSVEKVWYIAEPSFCLLASLMITALNPLLGAPLILTSISFAVNEWFQVNYVWNLAKNLPQDAEQEEFSTVRPA